MSTTTHMEKPLRSQKYLSWFFGLVFFAIGVVNTFWGDDPGFGIFILLLSMVYFIPVDDLIKSFTGIAIPHFGIIKVLIAMFIIWASVGVGELFDKIEIMMNDF
ncbi:MAG: hypothetical protein ACXWV4_07345 [Flavitalea sp.]